MSIVLLLRNLLSWLVVGLRLHAKFSTGDQLPLVNVQTPKKTVTLPIENCWHWMFTTKIAVGNPAFHFEAVIETASSDLFIPSVKCEEPEYCDKHPLYNSSASSTYIADGRAAHVDNGLYYSCCNASIKSYHVGGIEIKDQTFEEAVLLRPSYFFPESWHDSSLSLARKIVYDNEDSDLHATSPFQNTVQQGLLEEDVFSLRLPRTMHETGTLLLGGRVDDYDQDSAVQLLLFEERNHTKYRCRELYWWSGGWEVEPVYIHFGSGEDEIYYDLHSFVAKFTTWPPRISFPSTFTEWILEHLPGPTGIAGTMKCKYITPALPNVTIALRGVGGRIEEFVLTYEDYAKNIFTFEEPDSEWCSLPFGALYETEDAPKFILLGAMFLRKFYATFDEGAKSVFLFPRGPLE